MAVLHRIVFVHHVFLLLLTVTGEFQVQKKITSSSFSISDPAWFPSQKNRTLLSPNSLFAAGFLPSPSNSSLFLFSVWIEAAPDKTSVWSFARTVPSSSPLFISATGVLTLTDLSGLNLFFSSVSSSPNSSFLSLNNDGSLTFNNWTSFSSPTDTLLPNQVLLKSNILSSGDYSFNRNSLIYKNQSYGSTKTISSLTSDGALISGTSSSRSFLISSDYRRKNTLRRLTLDLDGNLRLYSLQRETGHWKVVWEAIKEHCKIPNTCGSNSICVPNQTYDAVECVCAPGFRPSSAGCIRKVSFLRNSKFLQLDLVEFETIQSTSVPTSANFNLCKSTCLSNPECVGFSYVLKGQRTCYIHYGELIHGYWSSYSKKTFFLRVSSSETDASDFTGLTSMINLACPTVISLPVPPSEKSHTVRKVSIIAILLALELLIGNFCFFAFLRRYSKYRDLARSFGLEYLPTGSPKRFSYAELRAATADFSNIIGSGGYGTVYRGQLPDGRTVAVKQLRNSSSGDANFWAEFTIVGRMHHFNLVRIWGFCAEKEQRILVYEYIPNGSLDKFLFQSLAKTSEEEWSKIGGRGTLPVLDLGTRFRIALGVARAIAYLHEECLELVLHCDIKPENILLDENFCPKVSDFGLSKLSRKKERVTMSMVRGTRGYMAPEWVMNEEPITAKADVYSFGVVLLELVSGIRCWDFCRDSVESVKWYFPRWAYDKVLVERKVNDVLDARIHGSFDDGVEVETVEKMVKTAMWCLQDRAEARPSMGKVVKMLEGSVELTEPAKPTIFYLAGENACADLLYRPSTGLDPVFSIEEKLTF